MDISYDHRSSIVAYIEALAEAHSKADRGDLAANYRATASSLAALMDVEAGKRGVASGVHAIIHETVKAFATSEGVEVSLSDVLDHNRVAPVSRVRFAAMWVAKKRLGWNLDRIAEGFDRSRDTIDHGVERAEDFRSREPSFLLLTDMLTQRPLLCEHCLTPFQTT